MSVKELFSQRSKSYSIESRDLRWSCQMKISRFQLRDPPKVPMFFAAPAAEFSWELSSCSLENMLA